MTIEERQLNSWRTWPTKLLFFTTQVAENLTQWQTPKEHIQILQEFA